MGNRNIKFTRDVRDAVGNSRTRILNKNSITFVSGSSLIAESGSTTNLVSPVVHNLTASGETKFGNYSFPVSDGSNGEVLSTDGNGQLSFVPQSGGGGGAPTNAEYVTISTDATLTNERVLTAGTDIGITDNGAGSTVVVSFTGSKPPADAQYVTLATDGDLTNERVLTAGTDIGITDNGAGSTVVVSFTGSVPPTDAQYVTLATDGTLSSERVLTAGTDIGITDNGAGSTVVVSFTGSVPPTDAQYVTLSTDGTLSNERVLTAGTDIGITDNGAGSTVVISYTGSSGGGAPTDAQYITLATDATLTNERVLTAGNNITLTDGGAGGSLTIANVNPLISAVASTSDQSIISTTTFTKWHELYLDFSSTGLYSFEGFFLFDSGTTPDIIFRFNDASGSATKTWQGDWARDNQVITNTGGLVVTGRGVGTIRAHMPVGFLNVLSAPYTMQVEFRQNISNATNTTVHSDSWLKATKLN